MLDQEKQRARFSDRTRAGYELAEDLRRFLYSQNPLVLAIPPHGVPVAAALAKAIDAPLDVIVSARIVAPGHEEKTLGAVTPDRTLIINRSLVSELGLTEQQVEQLSLPVWAEAQRDDQRYRQDRPYPSLEMGTALIVDDGLTTGYTMMAAVIAARKLAPNRIVVAVPVASIEAVEHLRSQVDSLISLEISQSGDFSVAQYYANYKEFSPDEVRWTLDHFRAERPPKGYSETF